MDKIKIPAISGAPQDTDAFFARSSNVIELILAIVGIVAVFIVMYNGLMIIIGGSDPKKIEKHIHGLIWAMVGIAVVLLSYALVNFVLGALTGTA
ncbi:hypothetical protein KC853_02320 [Candidatus Saccharibacteria bacterium]|nr:hypothetical protein [Candidatus Saccharibacteria bacterium]MCB9834542.1 hypothetical protein [Candidatus Nomurabacteria bacterium]